MTNLQIHLQKAKRIGTNLTILATSISLAACGGGGSEGFYGNNTSSSGANPSTGNDTQAKEVTGVTLALSKTGLNVKGDTITLTAKAVDKNGGGVAGTTITLNIKDAIKNGATADSSQVKTDEKGNATFTVTLNGSNTTLSELLFTATVAGTTISDVKKVAVTGAGAVTQSQYELKFDPVASLKVSGGETKVRVRAVDANGGGVPNENVVLRVKDFQKNGVTIKGLSSAITDNLGYAEFILELPAGREVDRAILLTEGVSLEAILTEANGATKTQIYTVAVSSVSNLVSNLTLATGNNKVDAVDGLVNVTVTAKNPEGLAVVGKDVQLTLDEQAIKYGAKLVNTVVKTDSKGEAVFTIQTSINQDNPDGKMLVSNGITVQAILKENAAIVTQSTKITVVAPVAEDVTSLSLAATTDINIAGGEAIITVTAKDKNGGALPGKAINLTIPQIDGLSIKNGSNNPTDSNGQAKFTVTFNPSNVSKATIDELLSKGIILTAQYTGLNSQAITQTTRVGFYQINVEKEVQRIELTATKGIVASTGDSVQVVARALDNEGNPAANRAISLGLTNEAQQNGVSFDGASVKTTDKDGYVSFTVRTNALNEQAVQKLVSSGIAVAVSTKLADDTLVTQNTTIMVAPSVLSTAEVAYLDIVEPTSLDIAKPNKNMAIMVLAYKSNGATAANKDINLSLDRSYSAISIDNSAPTTNSSGQATFTLKYDPTQLSASERSELLQSGLNMTAKFGAVIQKTKLSFYSMETNIQRMDLVVDKPALVAKLGVMQPVKATVTLKDATGAAIKNRQVIIAVDPAALQQGVSFTGGTGGSIAVTTDANGQATAELMVNAKDQTMLDTLLSSGIGIGAAAVQGDGGTINQSTKINVLSEAAENEVGYLTAESSDVIATTGGSSTISVKAFNAKGIATAGKTIKLNLGAIPAGLNIKADATSKDTDANGNASFVVTYTAATSLSAEQIKALLAGISATASHTNSAGKTTTQGTNVQFYVNQQNIQRMDLVVDKPALVASVNSAQTVTATVTLKDTAGAVIEDRQVTLALDPNALQNGVSLTGRNGVVELINGSSTTVQTNNKGQATVTLSVNPANQTALNALLTSGIGIGASAVQGDGSGTISQSTKINVLSEAAENEVGYLTAESSDVIATTGGISTISVKAFNSKGVAAAGKTVKLNLGAIPNGLNIKLDNASQVTDAAGNATFKVTYTAATSLSADQIKALLAGISAIASYTNSAGKTITQGTTVQFYVNQQNIQRMDLVVKPLALTLVKDGEQTVEAVATLVDATGTLIKDRQVILAISQDALQQGVNLLTYNRDNAGNLILDGNGNPVVTDITSGMAAVQTDENGQAKVRLKVKAPTQAAVDALVTSGIGIGASAVQGDGSGLITQNTRVNILSKVAEDALASEVASLSVQTDNVLDIVGGSANIVVKAFNPKGELVKGKEIKLDILANLAVGLQQRFKVNNSPVNGLVTTMLDNNTGEAKFKIDYEASNLTPEQVQSLLAGLQIKASYTSSTGKVTSQSSVVQFVSSQQNIQRMDLVTTMSQSPTQNGGALSLRLNDKKQFDATVTLKDRDGKPIANRQVILSLDNIAVDNNILFRLVNFKGVTGGSTVIATDPNGQVTVTIEALVQNQADLDALVASGITISASAVQGDGSSTINQTTNVRVVSEAAEAEAANAVSYLTAVGSQSLATTANGSTEITVKAFNAKGDGLAGRGISLALADIPAGLTITAAPSSSMSDITDSKGEAKFTVTYTAPADANLTPVQIKGLLAGIQATASHTDSGKVITQSTKIQFYANSAAIARDAQRLELSTSKGEVVANSDSFTLTTKVIDRSGNPAADRFVNLSLDAAAIQNGVTIAGISQQKTDTNGNVTFTVNVRGANQQMIDNLVANGIGLTASVVQSNGAEIKQTTQVMAKAPQTLAVSKLEVNPSSASIESTGGSTVIAVRAVDVAGNPVVNQDISFALGGINATNARVSVDKKSATTNSQGYAYFTVNIANGEVDSDLVKDGLTYAVNTINQNDGNSVNQVGKINVSVPAGTYNLLPLTPSKPSLLITGDTITVTSKLVDNNGAPLKSQPVTLVVNNVAVNGGVNVEGGMTAVTDVNGNVSFKLTLPAKTDQAQINELLTNGLTFKTSVTLPNGNQRFSADLKLAVEEAVSVYHFDISPSKTTLNVEGDETLVAVSLLDRNNQPVKNRKITLTARNTAGTVIVTGNGSVVETQPQTVTTDELGRGFYKVRIPSSGFDQDLLVASGILLDASNIDDNGVVTTQISRINVVSNTGGNNQLPSRYSLRLSSAKPTLNVRDDISDVTVTVIDSNGGGVAGKYVTLAISDFVRNGAIIVGPSGLTTDENGRATFRVKVDETARNQNYTATQFAVDDLILTARLSEEGYTAISQDSKVNVVQSVVQQPVASIVIGVNPTEISSSSDGVYYTRNMSASVVDFDGRPLSKQEVSLDITPLSYSKGKIFYGYKSADSLSATKGWIFGNQLYYPTVDMTNYARYSSNGTTIVLTGTNTIASKQNGYLGFYKDGSNVKYDKGTQDDVNDDVTVDISDLGLLREQNTFRAVAVTNDTNTCAASAAGTAITNTQVTNIPVKVPTFLGQGSTATYTTDAEGKFDFTIRYPKIYAQWLNVRIGATTIVASLPNRTVYDLGLPSLANDYSTDGTYGPNLVSPYGTTNSCP